MLRLLGGVGLRKGFLGGSRAWTVVGGIALGLRGLRHLTARAEKVVYCEELAPGESLVITAQAPPARKGR
ncbi:MAG: hypothetical protein ABIW46_03015 [Acidimicrobiales bacterium]